MTDQMDYTYPAVKILLIEDDKITVDVIERFLKKLYYIKSVNDAEAALDAAAADVYHVILLDINLGRGKNGIEALKEIRQIPGYINTPVVAMTAYAMSGDREKFIAAGCDYYIAKPFTKKDICILLEKINNGS